MIFSEEAEYNLIGACLLDNTQVDKVSDILSADDFYDPCRREMWRSIVHLMSSGLPADAVGVHDSMAAKMDQAQYGGLAGICDIAQQTVTTMNAEFYAKIVKDRSRRRRLQAVLGELEKQALTIDNDFVKIVDQAQSKISGLLGSSAEEVTTANEWMPEWLEILDDKYHGRIDPMGLRFGIPELDEMTSGMQPEDLVVIAGESGMGKTVVATNIMNSVAIQHRKPVVMYQLEMSKFKVAERMMAAHGNIKLDAFKDPKRHMGDDVWPRLSAAAQAVNNAPLVIDARPGLTPSQIRGSAKRWKEHFGSLGCIIIDHAGIVQPDDKSLPREQQVSEISKSAKILAKDLGCPVVLLSQINRENTKRADKRPMMSDLRESASLEHNADMILFIYREAKHNPQCDNPGVAELILAKHRDGQTGTVAVVCDLSKSKLLPVTADNVTRYNEENPRQKQEERSDGEDGFARFGFN